MTDRDRVQRTQNRPKKPPSYRQRRGYSQALVTLTDVETGQRKDYWLGEYGTPESHEAYYRVLAEYEALGRRLPPKQQTVVVETTPETIDVAELALEYWRRVASTYGSKRQNAIRMTLRLLRLMDGTTPIEAYGPRKLTLLREAMICGDAGATPPRAPWSRRTVNDRIRIIVAMFRWGVAQEIVQPSVADALGMVSPLKRGRSRAGEYDRVTPVPEHLLEATMPELATPVRALVEIQLLTGARPGEVVGLRPCDLERDERSGMLVARLDRHKTAHLGASRVVWFGPRAEEVLEPFIRGRDPETPLFSPREAEAERRERQHASRSTPLSCGNVPGSNRSESPRRRISDAYTVDSYRRAVQYACDRAFPPPLHLQPRIVDGKRETRAAFEARLSSRQRDELDAWRREHRWHPHQLRHNAATRIRREFGLEAAQLVLGHASAHVTDAVYAERDEARVAEVVRGVG